MESIKLLLRMSQAVKVMVRVRPMNGKQKERGCISVADVDQQNKQIRLIKEDTREPPKNFSYDYVFGDDCSQSFIYEQTAFSLVDSVLDGYNGTIFAYGQTGCGKTHTMMGSNDSEEAKGIIPRTFSQIITITRTDSTKTHLVRCSFIQIYNQEIHDLLGKDAKARMELKESPEKGVFVKDLLQIEVDSIEKMQQYMEVGFKNRAVRATNMNAESSRSHSIFTIYIDSQQTDQLGNEKYKASKLNLVDLAGSERASKTGATGDGMKEATKINLSLSALGNVISALVDGKTHHIPYRDSKLTRLLQDSLGGNTKTIMIAAISPANYNYDETLSTLRYASRAKFIQNKPKINEDPKDALLREYMDQIKQLKQMLEGKAPIDLSSVSQGSGSGPTIVYRDGESSQLQQELLNKENQLRSEQEQKLLLQEKLDNLQKHLQTKPTVKSDEKELERIKKLKEKLKAQKKKEEQYIREKQNREGELLSIEKNYKSLNEEVDEMKTRFKEIKTKYTANLQELKDIQNEHQDEKEQLLDSIREQQKEVKKYKAILNIIMTQEQIDHIVNNSQWNQENKEWIVPQFTYKEKNAGLPKLASNSYLSMARRNSGEIDKEKKQKEVVFKNTLRTEDRTASDAGFKVNQVLKNARENSESLGVIKSINSKNQLTPLMPLQTDAYQKARGQLTFQAVQKKRKMQKLNPIMDNRRNM